mmetsp:Transcript_49223/g.123378  ORF Transcript_49223/g.123378 Transcript_49223/m.123378 type:complete len:235 (-) Transcript_49223:57-761(-)
MVLVHLVVLSLHQQQHLVTQLLFLFGLRHVAGLQADHRHADGSPLLLEILQQLRISRQTVIFRATAQQDELQRARLHGLERRWVGEVGHQAGGEHDARKLRQHLQQAHEPHSAVQPVLLETSRMVQDKSVQYLVLIMQVGALECVNLVDVQGLVHILSRHTIDECRQQHHTGDVEGSLSPLDNRGLCSISRARDRPTAPRRPPHQSTTASFQLRPYPQVLKKRQKSRMTSALAK